MTVNALWPFLMMPRVGLQCVIVVFPDHTHLLFDPDQARLNVNMIWENIRLDIVEYLVSQTTKAFSKWIMVALCRNLFDGILIFSPVLEDYMSQAFKSRSL